MSLSLFLSNVDGRLQAMESQAASDAVTIASLQRKVKRLEKDTSRDGGRHQSRDATQWTWKTLRTIGEEIYQILDNPLGHAEFKAFVMHGIEDLGDLPPLRYRVQALRNLPVTKGAFSELRRVLAGLIPYDPRMLHMVVSELIAVFMVARDDFSPITLRTYLAIAGVPVERARSLPESSFKDVQVRSSISDHLRATVHTKTFYTERSMDMEWAIGEKMKGSGAYHSMLQSLAPKGLSSTGLSNLGTHHASVTEVGSAVTRPATRVSHVRQPPPPRFTQVSGDAVRMAGRCYACGRTGHLSKACPNPHPQYRSGDRCWLANEMSHGRIPLPT
jgi:hypothetical protein